MAGGTGVLASLALAGGVSAQSSDPLLNALIKKGILTEDEAKDIKAEAEANQSNSMPASSSKWKISDSIKSVELFGDVRMRYEYRSAQSESSGGVILGRERYALRFGLRGDLVDDFYYGFRIETAANPRSPWVTFGTGSASSTGQYQGPFGKSTAGLNLGEAYIGWRPESWLDVTIGKMPMPLYTTPMVWDTDINPEGLAEHFKAKLGTVDLFGNFGQFVYQDVNPNSASAGFFSNLNPGTGQSANTPFLLAWQGGFIEHVKDDLSVEIAATLYNYTGRGVDLTPASGPNSPGFSDIFVGQGAAGGGFNALGSSGVGSVSGLFSNDGFPGNQTGINDLLILEFPAQVDFKVAALNARVFGDFAENLDGNNRATYAYEAASILAAEGAVTPIPAGTVNQDKAYQIGLALGNGDLGLVYGSTTPKKGEWEARAYWQHVEEFALDPNLLDSDYFEGRGNLQGAYFAAAYSFADGIIGAIRYGQASRINKDLGTGGSNQDIPQVNPIDKYQIFQVDLTYKF
jgi:hypothetical protein